MDTPKNHEKPVPRQSNEGDNDTLKSRALQELPQEWRERLIADAGQAGVRHDNDVGWLLVGSVIHAAMSAYTAADAAKALQSGISIIPDQVYRGAVKAGEEVQGALRVEIKTRAAEAGQSLKTIVDDAAKEGAKVLKMAAEGLNAKKAEVGREVERALSDRIEDGVEEFAKAAAAAGRAAAKTSLIVKSSESMWIISMILLFFIALGAAGMWGFLLLDHRIVPDGVSAMVNPDGGTIIKAQHGVDVESVPGHDCRDGATCVYINAKIPNLP